MIPLAGLAADRAAADACSFAAASASPQVPSCPELATALVNLGRNDVRLRDWPNLARYRDQNRALAAPAPSEPRVVFMGDSITDAWPQPRFGTFFTRQALRRPRHQRPDDAADAHPLPSRRRRSQAEGGRDPRRHERHRGEHRSDDRRRDPGAISCRWPRSPRPTASRSCFPASCR